MTSDATTDRLHVVRARFGELELRIDLALNSRSEISRLHRLVGAAALAGDLENLENRLESAKT